MKTNLNLIIASSLILFCLHSAAQVKITVTKVNTTVSKDDSGKDLTAAAFQKNDLLLYFKLKSPVTGLLLKNSSGDFKIAIKPSNNKTLAVKGIAPFVIAKDPHYNNTGIPMKVVSGKKTDTLLVANSGGSNLPIKKPADVDADSAAIAKCKQVKLNSLGFQFIDVSKLDPYLDPCMPKECKCATIPDNTVIYDFGTKKTTRLKSPVKVGDPLNFRIVNTNPALYDVTMSDTSFNYFQELNKLLGYLSADSAIGNLGSALASAENAEGGCSLTLSDSIGKAVNELAAEFALFNSRMQATSPYLDATCLRMLMADIRQDMNANIKKYFAASGINSIDQIIMYLSMHAKDFSEPKMDSTLNIAYQKIFIPHYLYEYSIPEVNNVDQVNFLFNIVPKIKDAALPVVKNGSISVQTTGGFTWSVTSGLYYGFGFHGDKYAIRGDSNIVARHTGAVDSTINKRGTLYKEKDPQGEFGLSSFIHFYARQNPGVNFTGLIGVGVTFQDKPQLRYFAGGGILLGKDNRIAINGGAMFGNVDMLSNQYQKNAQGGYLPVSFAEASKDPVYVKQLQIKPFISISYNLSFLKKSGDKQQTATANTAAPTKEPAAVTADAKTAAADPTAAQNAAGGNSGKKKKAKKNS